MLAAEQANDLPSAYTASHSQGFASLLNELGVSLMITAHHAGKVVMVRAMREGVNTHFADFHAPMGLAVSDGGDRLAIGTAYQVTEYHNVPELTAKFELQADRDACYLPRTSHVTGNIQIHEMAYGVHDQLWFVNTRFSCLASLDGASSFVPRWRPPFITQLEPSDRCHLNGLAMVEGMPRYVTALGTSDEPGGWRAQKAQGGVLIDVLSGETVCNGLSMPHSPRVHGGQVWVCESGSSTLGVVDTARGSYEPVAAFPGFTRGLEFIGQYAFIGLSTVRDSALFSGISITERLAEQNRISGVGVLDLVSGQVVELLRFDCGVREIFGLSLIPRKFPELVHEDNTALLENSFVLPSAMLDQVAATVLTRPQAHSSPTDPPSASER